METKSIKDELQIYTVAEIAKDFGFNPQTISRYLKEGKLQGKKVGKQWFVQKAEIIRFFGG